MKSRVPSMLGLAALLGSAVMIGVHAQTPAPAGPNAIPAAVRGERHPEMHAAMRNLNQAKNNLEKATHDYDGHRAKALDLVNQAMAEVKLGLESVKQ